MKGTILVVDDEPSIVDVLTYNLEKEHYRVIAARDGLQALQLARQSSPDLVVLDLMLPGMDGLEVCRELRKDGDVPIIMLTARDEEVDRVVGLELGADDYVVKPFSTRELIARIKTVLRRAHAGPVKTETKLSAGDLVLYSDRHEVYWKDVAVTLTSLEFKLLETFLRHLGQVLTREQLLNQVWGYDYLGDLRAVDTAVKRLRAKLDHTSHDLAQMISTIRGVGYKLSYES